MLINWGLLFLLGLIWSGIAISVTAAKKAHCPIPLFYFCGSLAAIIPVAAGVFCTGGDDKFSTEKLPAALCLAAASLLNGTGQAILMSNLKSGGRALAYAIPQMAFILPFLWSVCFWREHSGFLCWLGIFLIGGAILISTLGSENQFRGTQLSPKRLGTAFISMLFLGTSQICTITPFRFGQEERLSSSGGTLIILSVSALFFGILSLRRMDRKRIPVKQSAGWGMVWGVFAALSYLLLFILLKLFGRTGQTGLVFPVACAIAIATYSAYSSIRLKERMQLRQIIGTAILITGIFLVKLG